MTWLCHKQTDKTAQNKNNCYSCFFAKTYDLVFFPVMHPIRKKVASEINQSNCRVVIDMCCGTGNQIKYLKRLNLKKVIGIDISDNMLAVASKSCENGICIKKDASKTDYADNEFDAAILSFILHETTPQIARKIANEASRIVKNNGFIFITDYVFDKNTFTIAKMVSQLIERLIGGQHFMNFKNYYKNNLLENYTSNLTLLAEQKFALGAVRTKIFKTNKSIVL